LTETFRCNKSRHR